MPYNCTWFQNSFEASTFLFLVAWVTPLPDRVTVPGGLQRPCPVRGWDTLAPSPRGSVNSGEPARFLPSLIPLALTWRAALASALRRPSGAGDGPASSHLRGLSDTPGCNPAGALQTPRALLPPPLQFAQLSSAEATVWGQTSLCEGFCLNFNKERAIGCQGQSGPNSFTHEAHGTGLRHFLTQWLKSTQHHLLSSQWVLYLVYLLNVSYLKEFERQW